MLKSYSTAVALLLAVPQAVWAQQPRTYVDGGIRYQETVSETQRPLTATRYERRETVVQRPRYTTNMQESVRTYQCRSRSSNGCSATSAPGTSSSRRSPPTG